MDTKNQAALEVILAALSVRQDDTDGEFPDELHAEMVNAALDSVLEKPKPSKWLQIADDICHSAYRKRAS
jgi:hypothetical protein